MTKKRDPWEGGKRFKFLTWFYAQYPRKPHRDYLTVKQDLINARARLGRLETEMEHVVAYQKAFEAALYTRHAMEHFYEDKKRRRRK